MIDPYISVLYCQFYRYGFLKFVHFSQNWFVFMDSSINDSCLCVYCRLFDSECTFVMFKCVTVKKAYVYISWISVFLIG